MSIKYAILGLLAERPSHGYAVHASFEARLSDFWELNYGQVYQVLGLLEREGLIAGEDDRVGKRPPKKVYSVTSRGRIALRNWLRAPTDRRRPFRDDFYVRFLFAEEMDRDSLCAMIDAEIVRCRERLAQLTDRRDVTANAESFVPRLFGAAAVRHAEADLEALKECKSVVMQFKQGAPRLCADEKAAASPARLSNRSLRRA